MSQIVVIPVADQAAIENQLTRWRQAEEGLEHCTLFARVMQGLCLSELRKLHGNQNRGNPQLRNSPKKSENWADYIKTGWGFSDDKARLLIQMAEAAKPRLRKLAEAAQAGLGAIIDKPLSRLSEKEFAALKTVTHKLTDGKTNRAIQEELGLFKGDDVKPKGGRRERQRELTPEEQEAALNEKAQGIFKSFFVSVTQAQEDYRELLLRLPAASKNPEAEVGLVQLRDQLKPLLTLIEDAISTRQKLAR